MQIQRFSTGGFVIHRVNGLHLSAWFDKVGHLLDVEQYDKAWRPQRVSAANRALCATIGRVWAPQQQHQAN